MKTKKFFLAALAMMCAMTMTAVFTACSSDDDDDSAKTYTYTITFDFHSYHSETDLNVNNPTDIDFKDWMDSIIGAYRSANGTSTNTFTLNGTQSECDKKVYDDSKKAEETIKNIRGGSATVIITNTTTKKQVYSYNVQP